MDLQSHLIDKKSNALHVILIKDDAGKPSLLYDPGMGRPWSSENPQLAKFHAASCDGMACTWREAWTILTRAHPNFERDLMERIKSGNNTPPQNLNDN